MASFFLYWHRAIGRKWGPPEGLAQSEFISVCRIQRTKACFGHISLTQTQNQAPFFFIDSLFFKKYFLKISDFFSIGPTSWELYSRCIGLACVGREFL